MGLLPAGERAQNRQLNKGSDDVHDAELIEEGEGEQNRG